MPDYGSIEETLMQILGGTRRAVAVGFLDAPPAGVPAFEGSEPSSCSYWRLAAAGRSFYTVAKDHQNCPIGGYTHNLLAAQNVPELQQVLGLMSSLGYIRMEEVSGVFRLEQTPNIIAYAPLADASFEPSVVLVSGKPARLMLVAEAATRAGAMSKLPLLGRPTCMALSASISEGGVMSTGCIGNRIYTGVSDDELYFVLRGSDLQRLAEELSTIESANEALTQYHQERFQKLSTV